MATRPLFLLVLLALVPGCAGDASPPPDAAPATATPPPAAVSTKDLLLAGKYAEALAAAETALAASPDQDGAWDAVEVAAVRGRLAGQVLDRLSADQAIGGRTERHHALRASLAVVAGRPADVLSAARSLPPGDAASFTLAAVRAGAAAPADATPETLALLAAAADPAAPMDPLLDQLTGDRALVARAQLHLDRGDKAGAAALLAGTNPTALLLAEEVARLRLRAETDVAKGLATADAAAKVALEAGDAAGAAGILDAALPLAAGSFQADTLAKAAGDLRAQMETAKSTEGAAWFAAVQADASLRAGDPATATQAATVAAGVAATKARGQWALAMARAMAGDVAGVTAAATGLPGVRVDAVRALAAAMHGENPTLPSPGIDGADGAMQALLGAGWLNDPTPALTAAAAATDARDLRWWAELWMSRKPVPAETIPAQLAAENAARGWVGGGAAGPAGDASHPNAAAWATVLSGAADPNAPGTVGAWSRLRVKAAAKDISGAASELVSLASAVPPWRSGPWAPLLVLDGPLPSEIARDRALLDGLPDPLPVATVRHGWSHAYDATRTLWASGVSPLAAATPAEAREALWAAVARERVLTLAWLAGGPWPAEAVQARTAAEAAAGLKDATPMQLEEVRRWVSDSAVFSFLPDGADIELLVLTESKGRVLRLPPTFPQNLTAYIDALRGGSVPVGQGDRLRAVAIDPVADAVLGVALYHVVGRAPVGAFPIDALPEQADGLRYLAAIRNISHDLSFDQLVPGQDYGENQFGVSLVALLANQDEGMELKGLFPDAKLLIGPEATLKNWHELAPTARFLHVGQLPALPGGGFRLPGGDELTLAEVASRAIMARTVVIASEGDPAIAAARAAAFRQAGARDVLATTWVRDSRFHSRLLGRFWERTNRRWTGTRSLAEARMETAKETGPEAESPSYWGGYLLSSNR